MITCNISSFSPNGARYTIELTKEDTSSWFVNYQMATWLQVESEREASAYLYILEVNVAPNNSGETRHWYIDANNDMIVISQDYVSELYGEIVNVTPQGVVNYQAGELVIDIFSSGNDSLTDIYGLMQHFSTKSITHGVSVGGRIVTRIVMLYSTNHSTSEFSERLDFTISDGTETKHIYYTFRQSGSPQEEGVIKILDSVTLESRSVPLNISFTEVSNIVLPMDCQADVSWLSVSISYNYNISLTISAEDNQGAERSGIVTITGTDRWGNIITAQVNVMQKEYINTDVYTIGYEYSNGEGVNAVNPFTAIYPKFYKNGVETEDGWSGNWTAIMEVRQDVIFEQKNDRVEVYNLAGYYDRTREVLVQIFRNTVNNGTVRVEVPVYLYAGGIVPIWYDVTCNIGTSEDFEDYVITQDDKVIYNGRGFATPNSYLVEININSIVSNYLKKFETNFNIYLASGELYGKYKFLKDYSYNILNYNDTQVLTRNLYKDIPSGTYVSFFVWTPSEEELLVTDERGAVAFLTTSHKGLNEIEFLTREVGKSYFFRGIEYRVADFCDSIFIKYRNKYSVWDFLRLNNYKETQVTQWDKIENFAQAGRVQFQQRNYQANIRKTFTATTPFLTDKQSKEIGHLLQSTEIILLDNSGLHIPIIMKSAQVKIKEFAQERRLIYYEIEFEYSQTQVRR